MRVGFVCKDIRKERATVAFIWKKEKKLLYLEVLESQNFCRKEITK